MYTRQPASELALVLPQLTRDQLLSLLIITNEALTTDSGNNVAETEAKQWTAVAEVLRVFDNKDKGLTTLVFTFARTLAYHNTHQSTPDSQAVLKAVRIVCSISTLDPMWMNYINFIDTVDRLPSRWRSRQATLDNEQASKTVTEARKAYEAQLLDYASKLS